MKTIFWDEHSQAFDNIPVLNHKSKTIKWFYIKEDEYYLLYHNVEI